MDKFCGLYHSLHCDVLHASLTFKHLLAPVNGAKLASELIHRLDHSFKGEGVIDSLIHCFIDCVIDSS